MTISTVPKAEVTLLPIRDVQQRTGRGRTAIFELIKSGELEAVHFGARTVRIPSDSVDAYIDRCRREARRKREAS